MMDVLHETIFLSGLNPTLRREYEWRMHYGK